MRTQVPGYLALLYGRSANPCKRGFDPCKWIFRADRVWECGRGGRGGVNPGAAAPPRDIWFVYIDKARRTSPPPLPSARDLFGADGEGRDEGCSLQERPKTLAGLRRSILCHGLAGPHLGNLRPGSPVNQSLVRSDPKSDNPAATDQQQQSSSEARPTYRSHPPSRPHGGGTRPRPRPLSPPPTQHTTHHIISLLSTSVLPGFVCAAARCILVYILAARTCMCLYASTVLVRAGQKTNQCLPDACTRRALSLDTPVPPPPPRSPVRPVPPVPPVLSPRPRYSTPASTSRTLFSPF